MWQYIGNGEWIPGVPARDLTQDEYEQHRDAIDANTQAMGRALYIEDTPWIITDEIDAVDTAKDGD